MSIKPVIKSPSTSPVDSQDPHSSYPTAATPSSDKVTSIYIRKRPVEDSDKDVDSSQVFACISPLYAGMNSYEMNLHDPMLEAHMRQHARDQSRRMTDQCNEDIRRRLEQFLYEEIPVQEENPEKMGFCIIL